MTTSNQRLVENVITWWKEGLSDKAAGDKLRDLCIEKHIRWQNLSKEQQQWCADIGIVNGCGSKWTRWIVPNIFKSSCNHHDFNYHLGPSAGSRSKADLQFMASMVMESAKLFSFRCWWAVLVAFGYYTAVRTIGWIPWRRTVRATKK